MDEQTNEWMNERTNEWMNEWMNGWVNEQRINKRMHGSMTWIKEGISEQVVGNETALLIIDQLMNEWWMDEWLRG